MSEQLTTSVIEAEVGKQLQDAFRRVRDDRGLGSDTELARELGFTTTYTQWISLQRPWPPAAMFTLAAAANCHLDALLSGPAGCRAPRESETTEERTSE